MPEGPLHDLRARLAEATEDERREILLSFHEQILLEFRTGLMAAKRGGGDKGSAGDRAAAIAALHATVSFLRAHGFRDVAIPLVMLEGALLDLDHGRIPAMLAARAGGDRVSTYSTLLRGHAAGIMGALMKHAHMSRSQAEEWVSTKLNAAGHEVAPLTVRDWRKEAQNHKKNPELYEAYCTAINRPEWETAPESYAEAAIAKLISLTPQKEE